MNTAIVYNRARADGTDVSAAADEGFGYGAGSLTGFTPLYEGSVRYDIAGNHAITDPLDRWARITGGVIGVAGTGLLLEQYGSVRLNATVNKILDFSPSFAAAEGPGGAGQGYGPVYINPPPNALPAEIRQAQSYVDVGNEAIAANYLSIDGRVPTQGAIYTAGRRLAQAEARRASAAGAPYKGQVGHGPDTTWTANPQPFKWLDLDPRVNLSIGGQANRYPFGYVPTEFILGPEPGP